MNTPKEVSDVKNYYFFKWASILHFSASSKVGENNANLEKKKHFGSLISPDWFWNLSM